MEAEWQSLADREQLAALIRRHDVIQGSIVDTGINSMFKRMKQIHNPCLRFRPVAELRPSWAIIPRRGGVRYGTSGDKIWENWKMRYGTVRYPRPRTFENAVLREKMLYVCTTLVLTLYF